MTSSIRTKTCPNCQSLLDCHSQNCWCGDFPNILPLNTDHGCLCKNCLVLHMQMEIDQYLDPITPEKIKTVQALGRPSRIIEGIDYHINTFGAWVFTSWFLLRQGGCCGNGCTNCPYSAKLKMKLMKSENDEK